VTVIVTARGAFTLLLGWETLTVAFYLLAGASPRDPDRAPGASWLDGPGARAFAAVVAGAKRLQSGPWTRTCSTC
jgi:NADH:ubiquinone oxidoreductase subunit 5 (subunit L)/multisubunit Na+/H+ antiporter MnhA subunit